MPTMSKKPVLTKQELKVALDYGERAIVEASHEHLRSHRDDLLEALKALLNLVQWEEGAAFSLKPVIEQCQQAIAKAEGK